MNQSKHFEQFDRMKSRRNNFRQRIILKIWDLKSIKNSSCDRIRIVEPSLNSFWLRAGALPQLWHSSLTARQTSSYKYPSIQWFSQSWCSSGRTQNLSDLGPWFKSCLPVEAREWPPLSRGPGTGSCRKASWSLAPTPHVTECET